MDKHIVGHMGIVPPSVPIGFYILITLEKALRQWRESGKRNTFENYIRTLEFLGYKIL